MTENGFIPRQARNKDPSLYGDLATSFTRGILEKVLDLLPPTTGPSVVHDNGCGTGEVTRAIVARNPAATIKANDTQQEYVDAYTAEAKSHNWPAQAFDMPAESLRFPDNTFDLTVANFMIFLTADEGVPAMREMHRTLKPGGIVAYTSWALIPVMEPIQKGNRAARGPDAAPIRGIPTQWEAGEYLAGVAEQAGFEQGKVRLEKVTQRIPIKDMKLYGELSWSWLGRPESGWTEDDETTWDKAVAAYIEECESCGSYQKLDNGEWEVECVANVVLATK